jgi:hypothetical protein
MVTVWVHPGRGASQVEKSSRLNWVTLFLMVHVPLMFLSEWREFPSAPCPAGRGRGEFNDSSRLDVVEIARVA